MNDIESPDALLFLTRQCPHCPLVLASLCELVKRGAIGRLQVVNIEAHPEEAQAIGVRSVPWLRERMQDEDAEVREIAQESRQSIGDGLGEKI